MPAPWDDDPFADLFQVGVTPEMKGVKENKWDDEYAWLDISVVALKKRIWNAAIEEAINTLRLSSTGTWVEIYLELLRKLKK